MNSPGMEDRGPTGVGGGRSGGLDYHHSHHLFSQGGGEGGGVCRRRRGTTFTPSLWSSSHGNRHRVNPPSPLPPATSYQHKNKQQQLPKSPLPLLQRRPLRLQPPPMRKRNQENPSQICFNEKKNISPPNPQGSPWKSSMAFNLASSISLPLHFQKKKEGVHIGGLLTVPKGWLNEEGGGGTRLSGSKAGKISSIGGGISGANPNTYSSIPSTRLDTPFGKAVTKGCEEIQALIRAYNIRSTETDLLQLAESVKESALGSGGNPIHQVESSMRELILSYLNISRSWLCLKWVLDGRGGEGESLKEIKMGMTSWENESLKMLRWILSALKSSPIECGGVWIPIREVLPVPQRFSSKQNIIQASIEEQHYTILQRHHDNRTDNEQSLRDSVVNSILGEEKINVENILFEKQGKGDSSGGVIRCEEKIENDNEDEEWKEAVEEIHLRMLMMKKRDCKNFSLCNENFEVGRKGSARSYTPTSTFTDPVSFYGDSSFFQKTSLNNEVKVRLIDILRFIEQIDLKFLVTDPDDEQIKKIQECLMQPITMIKFWLQSNLYKGLVPFMKDMSNVFIKARLENKIDLTLVMCTNLVEVMFINCIYREINLL